MSTTPAQDVPEEDLDDAPIRPTGTTTIALGAIGITAVTALAVRLGFADDRPSPRAPFLFLAGVYLVTGAIAVLRMRARGELRLLRPRSGDLTFAALVAFLLFGLAFAFHSIFTSPGTKGHGWIVRIYLLLGDPFADGRHVVALGAALVGLLEELTWRGLCTPLIEERLGVLRGSAIATVLYAVAHIPAAFVLADPRAGLNPLLPLAALGCGAAWSYLRWRMERLPPVLLSHALFTWAVVEFPLWR